MTTYNDIILFVGVSTGHSSIMQVFPSWARELGLDAGIEGVDLPLDTAAHRYRDLIGSIRGDPRVRGALVTSHKARLYEGAGDLFDLLDGYAQLCREISCIRVRGDELGGWAKDPITARAALEDLLSGEGLSEPSEVLCLGAGGAGVAISVALTTMPDGPSHVTLVDRSPARIDLALDLHHSLGSGSRLDVGLIRSPLQADALIRRLPPGSLVINATGMGKDVPGSPVSSDLTFPAYSIVWDLNYRGDLKFLQIARRQQREQRLHVVDGWVYFLHGWTEVIAEVFGVDITPPVFNRLSGLAGAVRPP